MADRDMTQDERRAWLIRRLLEERADGGGVALPDGAEDQRELLRALMNVRPPQAAGAEFLAVQDAYLRARLAERGVTELSELTWAGPDGRCALWRGDITTLAADAIVNAANARMLGCFTPGHRCIDNAIHTFAGVQLRLACAELMAGQGTDEPTGSAKVTSAYNLPARFVVHTVGPIVYGPAPTARDELALRSCYRSCLDAALAAGATALAFCCISTGVFRYPPRPAARVATDEVARWLEAHPSSAMRVVYNVFSARDEQIYREVLGL